METVEKTKHIRQRLKEELEQHDTVLEVIGEVLSSGTDWPDLNIDIISDDISARINEMVLCIDTYTTKEVLLGCGSPTRYFSIRFSKGEAISGQYVDTAYTPNTIDLSDAEIDTIVDRYGLTID